MSTMRQTSRTVRGFTLTEAAIVLGIVGLILSAIWVAAGAVYANYRTGKTTEQIISIAQNIRSLYGQSALVDSDISAENLAKAKAIPSDMVSGTAASPLIKDIWGGAVVIDDADAQVNFTISMAAIPYQACIDLLVRTTGGSKDSGLVSVGTGAAGGTANTAFPVTLNTATANCATGNNVMIYKFRLKG